MRVNLGSIEISDAGRRAIRLEVGKAGLATRDEVKRFIIDHGFADLEARIGEAQEAGDRY